MNDAIKAMVRALELVIAINDHPEQQSQPINLDPKARQQIKEALRLGKRALQIQNTDPYEFLQSLHRLLNTCIEEHDRGNFRLDHSIPYVINWLEMHGCNHDS